MQKIAKYAVLRYVPSLEREEFINIGIAFHSPEDKYLNLSITDNFKRVKTFDDEVDINFLKLILNGMEDEFEPSTIDGFSEKQLKNPDLLNEYTKFYVNQLQFSEVKFILSNNILCDEKSLFDTYVYFDAPKNERITKDKVKSLMSRVFTSNKKKFEYKKDVAINIGSEEINMDFLFPSNKGEKILLNSLSFDYAKNKEKNALSIAKEWHWNINKIEELYKQNKLTEQLSNNNSLKFKMVIFQVHKNSVYDEALSILEDVSSIIKVRSEQEIQDFANKLVEESKIMIQ